LPGKRNRPRFPFCAEHSVAVIFVALGANLPHPDIGPPRAVLEAALAALDADPEVRVLRRSRWYASPPWPPSDQPWYVNGVAALDSALGPAALLERLHAVERDFGRARGVRNAARVLDLDLIDWHGRVDPDGAPALPHPRMHERGFVLLPLAELAPEWRHPAFDRSLDALIAALPPDTPAEPMADEVTQT
jgi:2-amino-4-hydroxy-6-hydroxymethyldihydropteridine diphosphokinase